MKKLTLILALMLLLTACTAQQSQETLTPDTHSPATDPTIIDTHPPTTDPTTIDTPSTETLPVYPVWYATELPPPLSYTELTTKDIPYSGPDWQISSGKSTVSYTVSVDAGELLIRRTEGWLTPVHTFDLPDALQNAIPIGCNGQQAYLQTPTQIVQVDLLTEQIEVLMEKEHLLQAEMLCHDVIYYINEVDGKAGIYRLYLPDLVTDTIYEGIPSYPTSELDLILPKTTLGKVGWTMMNPEILEIMVEEYANPDSIYKNTSAKFDFTEIWGVPGEIDTYQEVNYVSRSICIVIQEKTGIKALMRCWYDPLTGEYVEEFGIIDGCFTGTDLEHDHFALDS